jgi:hypothetical protein
MAAAATLASESFHQFHRSNSASQAAAADLILILLISVSVKTFVNPEGQSKCEASDDAARAARQRASKAADPGLH